MKISDKESVREYGMARLPLADGSVLNMKIQAVGSAYELLVQSPAWHVEPPATVMRGTDGRVIRDKDGQPVVVLNKQDPKFVAREEELATLRKVAYVYLGLVTKNQGGDVEWDTSSEQMHDDSVKFFRAIMQEMNDVGLSHGAILHLFLEINKLSVPSRKEVEAAAESFPGE